MKNGFVKSSPRFFRLISIAGLLLLAMILVLAGVCPAPLSDPANPALTPNPVKSAWFLLWIQELVSWSSLMIWPVMATALLFFLLPWLPGQVRTSHASWFPVGCRLIAIFTLLISACILILTLVAMFFRGANWALIF